MKMSLPAPAALVGPRSVATGLERSGLGSTGLGPMRPVPGDERLDPEHRKLKAVSREFEAVMLEQMLTRMHKAHLFKDPLDQGAGSDIFHGLMDSALSREMSRRGSLGLADTIYRELSRMQDGQKHAAPQAPPP